MSFFSGCFWDFFLCLWPLINKLFFGLVSCISPSGCRSRIWAVIHPMVKLSKSRVYCLCLHSSLFIWGLNPGAPADFPGLLLPLRDLVSIYGFLGLPSLFGSLVWKVRALVTHYPAWLCTPCKGKVAGGQRNKATEVEPFPWSHSSSFPSQL